MMATSPACEAEVCQTLLLAILGSTAIMRLCKPVRSVYILGMISS